MQHLSVSLTLSLSPLKSLAMWACQSPWLPWLSPSSHSSHLGMQDDVTTCGWSYNHTPFVPSRSLRNMRNYIHINLCISLGIAQLTFVAGVGSTGDPVPIHCQVVAVLLHYFFLVSFMWMLMEGVILYIALVRVFVERKKLYLFAFTVTSYGLPLLYLGLLTLPLGFALPTQPNYGYDTA